MITKHLNALQRLGYMFDYEIITKNKVIILKNGKKYVIKRFSSSFAHWINKIDEVVKQR